MHFLPDLRIKAKGSLLTLQRRTHPTAATENTDVPGERHQTHNSRPQAPLANMGCELWDLDLDRLGQRGFDVPI
jgi:hypothetical protein